jgi:response regulator RpfG family c-di-GMP phosphodiesterase
LPLAGRHNFGSRASLREFQLLIADDDAAIRDMLVRGLSSAFSILVATDGSEALAALKTTKPDAILVDEMMPGATGTEVLRLARELMPDVPRLLMTASPDPTAAMRAVNHGEIHRFYTKPLRISEVRSAIQDLVSKARGELALRAELNALRAHQAVRTTTRVAMYCEGEIGDVLERAAKRRGFDVVRSSRVETFESVIGAGGSDVVVVDATIGDALLADIAQLTRRLDVGTSLVLADHRGSIASLTLAFQLGAIDCIVPPWPDELMLSVRLERAAARPRERQELRRLTYDIVVANRELALANQRVEEGQVKLLRGLIRALEARDPYTAGHTERVSAISVRCGEVLGLSAASLQAVQVGAQLHDIGKIGIRDEVLYKPGRLTPEEYEVIKTHTVIGAHILEGIASLQCALPIVRGHHERPDGRGYPDGRTLAELPREVLVVSGADVFDAITSSRPYRTASTEGEGIEILQTLAGNQLDVDVVGALTQLSRDGRLTDLMQDASS